MTDSPNKTIIIFQTAKINAFKTTDILKHMWRKWILFIPEMGPFRWGGDVSISNPIFVVRACCLECRFRIDQSADYVCVNYIVQKIFREWKTSKRTPKVILSKYNGEKIVFVCQKLSAKPPKLKKKCEQKNRIILLHKTSQKYVRMPIIISKTAINFYWKFSKNYFLANKFYHTNYV